MNRRRPPPDAHHIERNRMLGERLGIPFPWRDDNAGAVVDLPSGPVRVLTGCDLDAYHDWIYDIGSALILQQPEYQRGGRPPGPSGRDPLSPTAGKKRGQRERGNLRDFIQELELAPFDWLPTHGYGVGPVPAGYNQWNTFCGAGERGSRRRAHPRSARLNRCSQADPGHSGLIVDEARAICAPHVDQ